MTETTKITQSPALSTTLRTLAFATAFAETQFTHEVWAETSVPEQLPVAPKNKPHGPQRVSKKGKVARW